MVELGPLTATYGLGLAASAAPGDVAFSAHNKTMQLTPIGSDPRQVRLAILQGIWIRGH